MGIISKTVGLSVLVGASVGGSWLGNEVRGGTTSTQRPWVQRVALPIGNGDTMIDINPVHIGLGLLMALFTGRPRTLWAFVVSALSAVIVSEALEDQIVEAVQQLR